VGTSSKVSRSFRPWFGSCIRNLGVQVLGRDCKAVTTLPLAAGDRAGELRLSVWSVRQWLGTPVNRRLEEHDQLRWFSGDELEELTLAHGNYQHVLGTLTRDS
jgi:hypothetical protein